MRAFLKGTPGLEAWSMLGKAFYHASPPRGEPDYELVIVDAPATGHALDMLRVPFVIESVAPPGILSRDAMRAVALLRDSERAGAVVVTLPEDMPVNETLELCDSLTNELKISVLKLVVNRVLPVLFEEHERDGVKALPEKLQEGSDVQDLAVAGKRRVLRETVQDGAIKRVRTRIDAPCTELPYLSGLETDASVIEGLSKTVCKAD